MTQTAAVNSIYIHNNLNRAESNENNSNNGLNFP
jgi:hypothetical protein